MRVHAGAALGRHAFQTNGRFTEAREAYVAILGEKRALPDEWAAIIGAVGIPADDLPDERSEELPARRSLAAATDGLTAAAAADGPRADLGS